MEQSNETELLKRWEKAYSTYSVKAMPPPDPREETEYYVHPGKLISDTRDLLREYGGDVTITVNVSAIARMFLSGCDEEALQDLVDDAGHHSVNWTEEIMGYLQRNHDMEEKIMALIREGLGLDAQKKEEEASGKAKQ
jgi:hypothetical protein